MVTLSVYNDGVYNDGIYNLATVTVSGLTLSGTGVSVLMDGKTQYLGTVGPQAFGIGDAWTVGFWAKPLDNKELATFFSTAGTGGRNEISVSTTSIPDSSSRGKPPAELRVLIKDRYGTTLKNLGWPDYFQKDTWTHVFLLWDQGQLSTYKNGVVTMTGVDFVDVSGTMSDSPGRKFVYGGAVEGVFATFSGSLGHMGIWNTILGEAELLTVVSGGFDMNLTSTSGSYTSTASLKHYYIPGLDPDDLGQDLAGSADLTKEHNMDFTNVISGSP